MLRHHALALIVILVIVLSYYLGRHAAKDALPVAPVVLTPAPESANPTAAPAPPAAVEPAPPVRKGMSWGVASSIETPDGIALLSCHGDPATDAGSCNAYEGDTLCSTPLPLLCLTVDDGPRPAGLHTPPVNGALPDDFYSGWAAGKVATTAPMLGTALKSRAVADKACASAFGEGWRVAEFHDGGKDKAPIEFTVQDPGATAPRSVSATGGWAFYAAGDPIRSSRFWVAIDDQPANCWD